jgi:hypothetical protein
MIPGIKPKNQNIIAGVKGVTTKEKLQLIKAIKLGSIPILKMNKKKSHSQLFLIIGRLCIINLLDRCEGKWSTHLLHINLPAHLHASYPMEFKNKFCHEDQSKKQEKGIGRTHMQG